MKEGTYKDTVTAELWRSMGMDFVIESVTSQMYMMSEFKNSVAEPRHWPLSYQFWVRDNNGVGRWLCETTELERADLYVDVIISYPLSWPHGLVTD